MVEDGVEIVALEEERRRVEKVYTTESKIGFSFSLSDSLLFYSESGMNIQFGEENE